MFSRNQPVAKKNRYRQSTVKKKTTKENGD
jgi:hypothetical protein